MAADSRCMLSGPTKCRHRMGGGMDERGYESLRGVGERGRQENVKGSMELGLGATEVRAHVKQGSVHLYGYHRD